jgi:hypothetical protein
MPTTRRRGSAVAEYDLANLLPHRSACRCGDDGRCEQVALALRDRADHRAARRLTSAEVEADRLAWGPA